MSNDDLLNESWNSFFCMNDFHERVWENSYLKGMDRWKARIKEKEEKYQRSISNEEHIEEILNSQNSITQENRPYYVPSQPPPLFEFNTLTPDEEVIKRREEHITIAVHHEAYKKQAKEEEKRNLTEKSKQKKRNALEGEYGGDGINDDVTDDESEEETDDLEDVAEADSGMLRVKRFKRSTNTSTLFTELFALPFPSTMAFISSVWPQLLSQVSSAPAVLPALPSVPASIHALLGCNLNESALLPSATLSWMQQLRKSQHASKNSAVNKLLFCSGEDFSSAAQAMASDPDLLHAFSYFLSSLSSVTFPLPTLAPPSLSSSRLPFPTSFNSSSSSSSASSSASSSSSSSSSSESASAASASPAILTLNDPSSLQSLRVLLCLSKLWQLSLVGVVSKGLSAVNSTQRTECVEYTRSAFLEYASECLKGPTSETTDGKKKTKGAMENEEKHQIAIDSLPRIAIASLTKKQLEKWEDASSASSSPSIKKKSDFLLDVLDSEISDEAYSKEPSLEGDKSLLQLSVISVSPASSLASTFSSVADTPATATTQYKTLCHCRVLAGSAVPLLNDILSWQKQAKFASQLSNFDSELPKQTDPPLLNVQPLNGAVEVVDCICPSCSLLAFSAIKDTAELQRKMTEKNANVSEVTLVVQSSLPLFSQAHFNKVRVLLSPEAKIYPRKSLQCVYFSSEPETPFIRLPHSSTQPLDTRQPVYLLSPFLVSTDTHDSSSSSSSSSSFSSFSEKEHFSNEESSYSNVMFDPSSSSAFVNQLVEVTVASQQNAKESELIANAIGCSQLHLLSFNSTFSLFCTPAQFGGIKPGSGTSRSDSSSSGDSKYNSSKGKNERGKGMACKNGWSPNPNSRVVLLQKQSNEYSTSFGVVGYGVIVDM
eukprot:MONOS_6977.1-p1 / transcript=MONOS_6977.1 / gene=MONOS_6977 / organism=Monocercomonoides_exilis_PA203 / gene_product=unspecified product / transcript_product=unspecified product / location=Mono_scaffold00229:73264-76071(+) / protein_length=885 / sequence_SO=supercontig / SO=protein_coding / is_pseudo=false